jgi:hypothetical protein
MSVSARHTGRAMPETASVIRQRDAADAAVRGIDRPLNKGLDDFVAEMLAAAR